MSTCERVRAHLNDFLDGTLGAAQAQELNAHLHDCGECRREYRALHATREMVRHVPAPGGERARQRVMKRFREQIAAEAERASTLAPLRDPLWRRPALGLGAVLAVGLAIILAPRLRPSAPQSIVGSNPIIIATAACTSALPTADALDEMTSAHAVESLTVQNGSDEAQHEALAEANSRLALDGRR
jgi:anti-sigma factor RsiW